MIKLSEKADITASFLHDVATKNPNERILEVTELVLFLDDKDIESVLDVGAFRSQYLRFLLNFGIRVSGVDITPDPDTYAQNYIIGDACEVNLPPSDLVICLSTIEHLGITQRQFQGLNHEKMQELLFDRCIAASKKYIFMTFPFGSRGAGPGYENVTSENLFKWINKYSTDWTFATDFRHNPIIDRTLEAWKPIPLKEAEQIPIPEPQRVSCVCILKGIKNA